jgi:hypothetical protein
MDKFKEYLQQHNEELGNEEPGHHVWKKVKKEIGSSSLQQNMPGLNNTAGFETATKRKPVIKMMLMYAAAACIIGLACIGVWHLLNESKTTKQAIASLKNTTLDTQRIIRQPAENIMDSEKVVNPVTSEPTAMKIERGKSKKYSPKTTQHPIAIDNSTLAHELDKIETSFTGVIDMQKSRLNATPLYAENSNYFSDFKKQLSQMEKDERLLKNDISHLGITDELLGQLINLYQQKLNVLQHLQNEIYKTNNRYKQTQGPVNKQKTYFLNL